MITRVIEFSARNRGLVLVFTVMALLGAVWAVRHIPLDAIPDLSDTQVIIYTEWPGQAPQLVQDQVTYPITTKMLAVPHAKVVRGYSYYGFSFVYVIFDDGTDPYWARSRVLEYVSGLTGDLPAGVTPRLGPDATGVGWAFMYAINSPKHDLAELRSMQDWFLRFELKTLPNVAEVASIGGMVRQYQVIVDPVRLAAYGVTSQVGVALPHSRAQESEADHIGLIYMARAGYDPRAAVTFWQRFADYNKQAGGSTPVFLRTHPTDATRIQQLQVWMPEALAQYHPAQ